MPETVLKIYVDCSPPPSPAPYSALPRPVFSASSQLAVSCWHLVDFPSPRSYWRPVCVTSVDQCLVHGSAVCHFWATALKSLSVQALQSPVLFEEACGRWGGPWLKKPGSVELPCGGQLPWEVPGPVASFARIWNKHVLFQSTEIWRLFVITVQSSIFCLVDLPWALG